MAEEIGRSRISEAINNMPPAIPNMPEIMLDRKTLEKIARNPTVMSGGKNMNYTTKTSAIDESLESKEC